MLDEYKRFGASGEDFAVEYFLERGFRVVARNWQCRFGEIDVIVERGGVTHFVEVKTRRSLTFGHPEEGITPSKLRHLARTIEVYLAKTSNPPSQYQADALAITILPGKQPEYYFVEYIL